MIPHEIKIALMMVGIGISRIWTIKYIKDILAHKTKPHIYTWIIWFITQSIGVAGMWVGGGGVWSRWPTIGLFGLTVVIILSIKHGTKDITKLDMWMLIWWVIALWLWWMVDNPLWAVILVSCIDTIWYIPSFRKTFVDPQSETLMSWIGYCISNIFIILSLAEYNLLTTLYISIALVCNIVMVIIIISRRSILRKDKPSILP